jgi:hypothetical protein
MLTGQIHWVDKLDGMDKSATYSSVTVNRVAEILRSVQLNFAPVETSPFFVTKDNLFVAVLTDKSNLTWYLSGSVRANLGFQHDLFCLGSVPVTVR